MGTNYCGLWCFLCFSQVLNPLNTLYYICIKMHKMNNKDKQ